jgi:hypothetical protein
VLVNELIPSLVVWTPTPDAIHGAASSLIAEGLAGQYRDYAAAEQATMAVQSLAATLLQLGALDRARADRINESIEALLSATRDSEAYNPASLAPQLRQVQAELR